MGVCYRTGVDSGYASSRSDCYWFVGFVSRARASVYLSRRAFAGDFDPVAERFHVGYRAFAAARYRASGVAAGELRGIDVEVFDCSAVADVAEDSCVRDILSIIGAAFVYLFKIGVEADYREAASVERAGERLCGFAVSVNFRRYALVVFY